MIILCKLFNYYIMTTSSLNKMVSYYYNNIKNFIYYNNYKKYEYVYDIENQYKEEDYTSIIYNLYRIDIV